MQKRLTYQKLLSMNLYWFGLSFLWNTLHPIVLPALLLNYVPEIKKNTYLGLLTFVGLVLAMIVQPMAGSLSDHVHVQGGKRRPFILLGTIFDLVVLLLFIFVDTLTGIFLGYIALQISSNIAHGPMQALIPDLVPDDQKGSASGIKNLMDVLGLIIASLVAGRLITPGASDHTPIFLVIMAVLLGSALITILTTKERGNGNRILVKENPTSFSIKEVLKIDLEKNNTFKNLIVTRFIFLLGVYGIQTFAQYYIRDVLAVDNAIKATGDVMAAIAAALVVCVLVSGYLSDKLGPVKLINFGMLVTAIGGFSLIFVNDINTVTILAGIIGGGMGFFLTSNWTLAVKLAPEGQAGKYLGLTNLATAGAGAIGRLEGPLIDFANGVYPEYFLGYKFMFLFCFLCSLLSCFIFNKIFKMQDAVQDTV